MGDREVFRADDRQVWREWLEDNFQTKKEVFLVFPSKASGEDSVSYNDAVEEALCFGWIDGVCGKLDDMHTTRRFTPRRKGSPYSRPNVERLILMDMEGKIHPSIRDSVKDVISEEFVFPKDIIDEIRRDPIAWNNYKRFSESYKRIRIAYIDAARKRPDEFRKRLDNFIARTRENRMITGYGGVEKYYG